MKKFLLLFLLLIPFCVNAENYYLNNLKEGQEFSCDDKIVYSTPNEVLSTDAEALVNKYGNLENGYGRTFVFEDLNSTEPNIVYPGNGTYCPPGTCSVTISCNDDGKDKYYKLSRVEYDPEAFFLYFKAYEKRVNLVINNYVNGLEKYVAKKDEVLEYSINIKNNGDGKSNNNIIITNIPKELILIENTISDNGIFNKTNNNITWNYDELKPNEEYTFYYYAKVKDDNVKEYVGKSSITSNQVQEKVISKDTIVTIEKKAKISNVIKNPNTKTETIFLIVVISVMLFGIIILMRKKKILNN